MAEHDPPISVRLPRGTVKTLEMLAAGERTSVSEIIRIAIDQYLNPPPPKGSK